MIVKPTLLLSEQSEPSTPASGRVALYSVDGSALLLKDDSGTVRTLRSDPVVYKALTSAQNFTGNSDTYLTDSAMIFPQARMQAGVTYRARFVFTKTAAGTAAAAFNVRVGTAGSTADASMLSFSPPVQTANADTGSMEVFATFRSVGSGSSAVLASWLHFDHNTAVLGFANITRAFQGHSVSAGFDSTAANTRIGVSVNPGASADWTLVQGFSELLNLL